MMRTGHSCSILPLRGGQATCADGMAACQAKGYVVVRVEPLAAERALEILQVVDVHLTNISIRKI